MALLGHVSAEMSVRYGRLFDATVRDEYERALTLAKQQARPPGTGRTSLPLTDITGGADWKNTPLIKSRLAGGFCLRAPAQGACTYANICEHCPSFHTDASSLPILAAQRVDSAALAADAEQRGWINEAERHLNRPIGDGSASPWLSSERIASMLIQAARARNDAAISRRASRSREISKRPTRHCSAEGRQAWPVRVLAGQGLGAKVEEMLRQRRASRLALRRSQTTRRVP